MEKSTQFIELMEKRRSQYALTGKSPIGDEDIAALIQAAILFTPSAFNSQSARVAVLFGAAHAQLWDIVMKTLRARVPAEKFKPTEEKINAFKAAHGTVLYFEDMNVVAELEAKFPTYKENFPVWAAQSNGMLEFAVWNVLAENGLGASLQHYNPLIDEEVRQVFKLPTSWKLFAQMPFGETYAPAGEKTFLPIEERVKIFA